MYIQVDPKTNDLGCAVLAVEVEEYLNSVDWENNLGEALLHITTLIKDYENKEMAG